MTRPGRTARGLVWGVVLALVLVSACAKRVPPPPGRVPPTQRPYTIKGRTYHPLPHARGFQEVGLASWYGPGFHGRKTASGEIYDQNAMTAAHKILPMNTWVEVTNLENGRKVRVRINDRGPFVDGRVIDLSRAAAARLGIIGPGTAQVRLVALGYRQRGPAGAPTGFVQPASYHTGTFTVQVGAFVNESNAWRLAARLRPKWGQVFVKRFDRGDKVFYRVRVGKLRRLEAARALQRRLRAAGFAQAFAVAW